MKGIAAIAYVALAAISFCQSRIVPAIAFTNIQSNHSECASNVSEVLTEFTVKPVVTGRGLRFATTNWGIGDELTNPYAVGSNWFGNDKYPGYQESRAPHNSIFVEYAVRRADGSWLRLKFNGESAGEIAGGSHRWTDWLDTQVSPTKPLRVRMRIRVRVPFFDRILRGNANAYDSANSKTYAGMNAPQIDTPSFHGNANVKSKSGSGVSAHIYPAIVQTKTETNIEGVFVLGDSILRANSDIPSDFSAAAQVAPGWIGRGLSRIGVPVVAAGTSGDACFLSDALVRSRLWALVNESGCRTGLIQLGVNDAASGSSLGGLRPSGLDIFARTEVQAALMKLAGMDRVYVAGTMPLTTSSEAWTDSKSQKLRDFGYSPPNWVQYNSLLALLPISVIDASILPLSYVSDGSDKWRSFPTEATGTIVAVGTDRVEFVPPSQTAISGRYVGYAITFLDGAAAGQKRYIYDSPMAGSRMALTLTAMPESIQVGDRFELIPVLTRDGVHPSPLANILGSQAIVDRSDLFIGDRRP